MVALTDDLAKVKVLIVDDDYGTRKTIRSLLTTMGYTCVRDASDGAGGLDAVLASRPDVVLLDWDMPDMTGAELVRRIRSAGMPQGVQIIMLAQPAARSGVPEAMRLGVHDFLLKPVTLSALRTRLASVLAKRRVDHEQPEPQLQRVCDQDEAGRSCRRAPLHA
jgi:two-component system chemotaxis response regulator CheY